MDASLHKDDKNWHLTNTKPRHGWSQIKFHNNLRKSCYVWKWLQLMTLKRHKNRNTRLIHLSFWCTIKLPNCQVISRKRLSLQQLKIEQANAKNQFIFLQRSIYHNAILIFFKLKTPVNCKKAWNIIKENQKK